MAHDRLGVIGSSHFWHQTQYGFENYPAFILAPAAWSSWSTGASWTYPRHAGLPSKDDGLALESVLVEAAGARWDEHDAGACRRYVEVHATLWPGTIAETFQFRAEWSNSSFLPTTLEVKRINPPDSDGSTAFRISLLDQDPGTGIEVPIQTFPTVVPPPSAGLGPIGLVALGSPEGMLDHARLDSWTDFEASLGVLLDDERFRTWRGGDEGVRLLAWDRRQFAEGNASSIWKFVVVNSTWTRALTAMVRAQDVTHEEAGPNARVETMLAKNVSSTAPPLPGKIARLSDLRLIATGVYGRPPEVISCIVLNDLCTLGTHENTQEARHGDDPTGLPRPGLIFWLSRGLLLQEDSVDSFSRRPSLGSL